MAGNSYGTLFRISTFGESHGPALGVVIDGCPAGLEITQEDIQVELNRRKPGQSKLTTQRKEEDQVEILSGVFEDKSMGTPIAMLIRNADQKSKDYDHIKDQYRPSHADFTYDAKYGFRDYRGGGRSSARETAARVAAGAIAKKLLRFWGIELVAYVNRVKHIEIPNHAELDFNLIDKNDLRCPHLESADKMQKLILETKKNGDTLGGSIKCVISNCPAGLGEPVFDKLNAELAKAISSINACKYIEFGSGKEGTFEFGSEQNDAFISQTETKSNNSGGIQGGISNGQDICFEAGFKPVATIMKDQESINKHNETVTVKGKGRHDACVLPRAVPIVESMAAIVLVDFYLRQAVIKL